MRCGAGDNTEPNPLIKRGGGCTSYWLERLQAGSIYTWDDLTTRFLAQFFPPGRTTKLCNDILMFQQHQEKAWATIEKLAQYEDEGWNDPVIPEEGGLNYKNPDIEQLLRVVEYKVDMLMKDAISLIGRSEGVFGMTSNQMHQLPPEPSRQEEFEHIVTNFILDQEERAGVGVRRFGVFKNGVHQMHYDALTRCPIHFGDVIDWEFFAHQNLDQVFFESINTDPFSGPQWANLFRVNEPIYQELVREFFASFEFDASPCRENATLSGLSMAETVKEIRLLMEFWPSIGDGGFNVGNTKVASIRDPKEKELDFQGMIVTKIALSFWLLTNEMRDALSVETLPLVFKKKVANSNGDYHGTLQWGMHLAHDTNSRRVIEAKVKRLGGESPTMGDGGSLKVPNKSQGIGSSSSTMEANNTAQSW
ncbi:zinc finger, CCHC-type containing protein [Tanacetum coccineum]|uniref:Zinc finger, CCHC-type containing protein n=1 Tax=Tanacetum coccineum TaxID=301880 RepID=A0ABQ5BXL0_9ASTR